MEGQPFPKRYQTDQYPENRYAYVPIDVARILGTGSALSVYVAVDAMQLNQPRTWPTAERVQRYIPGLSLGVIRAGMKRCRDLGLMELRQNDDAHGAAFRVRIVYNLARARYSRGPIVDTTPPKVAGRARSRKIMSERAEADKMPHCSGMTVERNRCRNRAMEGCLDGLCQVHHAQAERRSDLESESRFANEAGSVEEWPRGLCSDSAQPSPSAPSESKRLLTAEKRQRGKEAEPTDRTAVTSSALHASGADGSSRAYAARDHESPDAAITAVDPARVTDADLTTARVVPIARGRQTLGAIQRKQAEVRSTAADLGLTEVELYAAVDFILDPRDPTESLALSSSDLEVVLGDLPEVAPLVATRLARAMA